jgi:asparagine synthase (glutamine-hydrolysing)
VCGIVGVLNNNEVSWVKFSQSLDALAHRGPDSRGEFREPPLLMGGCRLEIRGGSFGNQPISSKNEDVVLVYNGEIYNTRDLAEKYSLRLSEDEIASDSLFLAEFLSEFKGKKLSEIDGAFAFAAYFRRERHLIAGRDRYGQRPLYISFFKDAFYFSSEIRPLLMLCPELGSTLNYDALYSYFIFQNIIDDTTIFRNINQIKPGHTLTIDVGGKNEPKWDQFWEPTFSSDNDLPLGLDNLINAGFESQFLSKDQPASCLISGGVDSAIIAAQLAGSKKNSVSNFITLHFPDEATHEFNEWKETKRTADLIEIEVKGVEYRYSDWVQDLSTTIISLEQPRVGQSCLNYAAYREASKYGKVCFSGAGADELFGGYPWRYPIRIEDSKLSVDKNKDNLLVGKENQFRLIGVEDFCKVFPRFSVESAINLKDTKIEYALRKVKFDENEKFGLVTKALAFDLVTFLPGLLSVDDKLGMRSGVEVRTPYLSNRIVDFALSLQPNLLFQISGNEILGKSPLRLLLKQMGLAEVGNRRKRGFSSPDALWISSYLSQEGKAIFRKENRIWEILDRVTTLRLYDQHQKHLNLRAFFWSVISLHFLLQGL